MKDISLYSFCNYELMKMPILANRECFLYACGYNRLEHDGTIIMFAKSIDKDKEFQKLHNIKIPKKGKTVRMDSEYFATRLKIINEDRIFIHAYISIDSHFDYIPDWIVNFGTRTFGSKFFISKKNVFARSENL